MATLVACVQGSDFQILSLPKFYFLKGSKEQEIFSPK
jgi:hypothetical protein